MAILFTLLTFVSTFLGGLLGFKYKDKLHLILGFTAGVLISVVAFDVFPEIITQIRTFGGSAELPMVALVLGFLVFHILEKWILIHHQQEELYGEHKHPTVGLLSALALSGHSFLDGIGIGLGFQVSSAVGILVAIAVIAHDFSDGLNTVSLMLAHKNSDQKALMLLFLDAVAPILGVVSTLFFRLEPQYLVAYLGFFAGFLLYIGASDILPEAHSRRSSPATVAMTVLGVGFIYLITRLV